MNNCQLLHFKEKTLINCYT